MTNRKDKPASAGEVIAAGFAERGLSISEAAQRLGVRRATISDLVRGRSRLSVEMARRLEAVLDLEMERTLGAQLAYDIWVARQG